MPTHWVFNTPNDNDEPFAPFGAFMTNPCISFEQAKKAKYLELKKSKTEQRKSIDERAESLHRCRLLIYLFCVSGITENLKNLNGNWTIE